MAEFELKQVIDDKTVSDRSTEDNPATTPPGSSDFDNSESVNAAYKAKLEMQKGDDVVSSDHTADESTSNENSENADSKASKIQSLTESERESDSVSDDVSTTYNTTNHSLTVGSTAEHNIENINQGAHAHFNIKGDLTTTPAESDLEDLHKSDGQSEAGESINGISVSNNSAGHHVAPESMGEGNVSKQENINQEGQLKLNNGDSLNSMPTVAGSSTNSATVTNNSTDHQVAPENTGKQHIENTNQAEQAQPNKQSTLTTTPTESDTENSHNKNNAQNGPTPHPSTISRTVTDHSVAVGGAESQNEIQQITQDNCETLVKCTKDTMTYEMKECVFGGKKINVYLLERWNNQSKAIPSTQEFNKIFESHNNTSMLSTSSEQNTVLDPTVGTAEESDEFNNKSRNCTTKPLSINACSLFKNAGMQAEGNSNGEMLGIGGSKGSPTSESQKNDNKFSQFPHVNTEVQLAKESRGGVSTRDEGNTDGSSSSKKNANQEGESRVNKGTFNTTPTGSDWENLPKGAAQVEGGGSINCISATNSSVGHHVTPEITEEGNNIQENVNKERQLQLNNVDILNTTPIVASSSINSALVTNNSKDHQVPPESAGEQHIENMTQAGQIHLNQQSTLNITPTGSDTENLCNKSNVQTEASSGINSSSGSNTNHPVAVGSTEGQNKVEQTTQEDCETVIKCTDGTISLGEEGMDGRKDGTKTCTNLIEKYNNKNKANSGTRCDSNTNNTSRLLTSSGQSTVLDAAVGMATESGGINNKSGNCITQFTQTNACDLSKNFKMQTESNSDGEMLVAGGSKSTGNKKNDERALKVQFTRENRSGISTRNENNSDGSSTSKGKNVKPGFENDQEQHAKKFGQNKEEAKEENSNIHQKGNTEDLQVSNIQTSVPGSIEPNLKTDIKPLKSHEFTYPGYSVRCYNEDIIDEEQLRRSCQNRRLKNRHSVDNSESVINYNEPYARNKKKYYSTDTLHVEKACEAKEEKAKCETCKRNDFISDKTKMLSKEMAVIKETMNNYKSKIEQLELEKKMANKSFDAFYSEVEKNKTQSYFSSMFNHIFPGKKKSEEAIRVNQIKEITDYVKTLQRNLSGKEITINKQTEEYNVSQKKLSEAQGEIKKLNRTLKEKTAKQTKIIEETDNALKSSLHKYSVMENSYVSQIAQKNKELINKDKFISNVKEQNIYAKNEYTKEIENYKRMLEQTQSQLEKSETENQTFKSLLKQETARAQEFQKSLAGLTNIVYKQQNILTEKRKAFNEEFVKISFNVIKKNKKISLNDIEKGAHEKFIQQAVNKMLEIENNVKQYENQINEFQGDKESKTYSHIKEMLQRAVEKLDNIESQKISKIQARRKESVFYVKRLQSDLERKVN